MAEAIIDTMGAVLARWTMGAAAAPAASIWHAELGAEPNEAELRLLALSGQFLTVAVSADPPSDLRTLPDLPALALPTLPEALRPLMRRILASRIDMPFKVELVQFLTARGWTAHPADWMPPPNAEDVPDVYAPWRDWAEIAASAEMARQQARAELTAATWDDYWPAARKAALAELRRRDPGAARTLLEAKLATEGADVRLRLLGLLAIGLSDADVPFLESTMTADRAPKVKALAASLLARLGLGPAAGEDAAELAGFFSVKAKGLLRRSRVIQLQNTKTPAQHQRRAALFETVDIASLAGALGLAPDELISAWPWESDRLVDAALVALVDRTGTDAHVAHAANVMSQCDEPEMLRLAALASRLAAGQRSDLAARMLLTRRCSFEMAKAIAGPAAGLEKPLESLAGRVLLAALERDDATPFQPGMELHALGMIASRTAAQQTLARLNGAGLPQGDPRLDMLRINAALEDSGVKQ
jgi:hypothetical protein